MLFSDVEEAFPYRENINDMRKAIIHDPRFEQSFYDTQGGYVGEQPQNNNMPNGTSIETIKQNINNNQICKKPIKSIKKYKRHSCEYYYKKFIETLTQNDLLSLTSSEDLANNSILNDVYDHLKICSFCKKRINDKITETDDTKSIESFVSTNIINTSKNINIKDITIIILVGIVIIFILDMFVKIGRKTKF